MAPAFSTRSANTQCQPATQSFIALTPPNVKGQPGLKSNRSLIAEGTPCNGPVAAPDITACSAALAAFRASSKPSKTKALRLGLRRSMRAMQGVHDLYGRQQAAADVIRDRRRAHVGELVSGHCNPPKLVAASL